MVQSVAELQSMGQAVALGYVTAAPLIQQLLPLSHVPKCCPVSFRLSVYWLYARPCGLFGLIHAEQGGRLLASEVCWFTFFFLFYSLFKKKRNQRQKKKKVASQCLRKTDITVSVQIYIRAFLFHLKVGLLAT